MVIGLANKTGTKWPNNVFLVRDKGILYPEFVVFLQWPRSGISAQKSMWMSNRCTKRRVTSRLFSAARDLRETYRLARFVLSRFHSFRPSSTDTDQFAIPSIRDFSPL